MAMSCRSLVGGVGLALGMILAGCGGTEDDLPRQAISGKVSLDGQPLESGTISFEPAEDQTNAVSVGAVIREGSYAIERSRGPTPGKYLVSITDSAGESAAADAAPGELAMPPKGRVPEKYNAKSTLTVEVKPDDSKPFDFELSSH